MRETSSGMISIAEAAKAADLSTVLRNLLAAVQNRLNRFHVFAIVRLVWLLLPAVASAQILTENAGVTSPETPTLREYFTYFESKNLTDVRLNHQLLVGLDSRTELRLTIPTILRRRASFRGFFGATDSENMAGFGDVSLRLKYSLSQTDEVMASTRWAILAELVAPTGDHDKKGGGGRIARRLQLGSGGWGIGIGTAYSLIRNRHRFSTDVYFRHRTRHDGERMGQSFDWSIAYWYRLTPAKHDPENETTEVRGVIEILNSYRIEGRIGDHGADDQGLQIWVAPGIQIYPRRDLLIEASVQIPAIDHIDDSLGDRRWAFLIAVKFLF